MSVKPLLFLVATTGLLAAAGFWFDAKHRASTTTQPIIPTAPTADAVPQNANDADLPPEFAKLIEQQKKESAAAKGAPDAIEVEEERGLKIGAAMPELKGDWLFAGAAENGAPDYKNKVLLIDFFTTVCGSCVESIPDNNAIADEFKSKGLILTAATPEPKELVRAFNANFKTKMRYPVLTHCDALFETCDVKELPVTLLFGKDGKLAWKGGELRKNGKLEESFAKALEEALNK